MQLVFKVASKWTEVLIEDPYSLAREAVYVFTTLYLIIWLIKAPPQVFKEKDD